MVAHTGSARAARSARRLNAPRPALVEGHADGTPRRVNRQAVAVLREEWRVVDRWWTEEPVARRYFDVVLETGENAVVYRDDDAGRGSRSVRDRWLRLAGMRSPRVAVSVTSAASSRAPPASTKLSRAPAPYVELHAHSAYSFLDGASLPEELAARAAELGYDALALTDHDGVYGSLEFAHAAKHLGVRPITGAEVTLAGGAHVTLLCETQRGYANLCRILTDAHARHAAARTRARAAAGRDDDRASSPSTPKGSSRSPAARGTGSASSTRTAAARLARAFPGAFYVELQRPVRARRRAPQRRARRARARRSRVPTVATGDVHAHHPRRAQLQDALVAISNRTSLDGCERERRGNHESVLLPPARDARAPPARRGASARARSPTAARST